MAETPSAAKQVAEGLRSILERIGAFFHIFDLSFFVSGSLTFGALAFLYVMAGAPRKFPFADWVGVIALVVCCYVCGLISFAAGRAVNGRLFRSRTLETRLGEALSKHNVSSPLIDRYLGKAPAAAPRGDPWRLYIRMWAEIAHTRPQSAGYNLLSRYWVMAATYDGVAISFVVWALVVLLLADGAIAQRPFTMLFAAGSAALLCCLALLAFRQGANYYEYQIEDLVAEFAVESEPLLGQAAAFRSDSPS
ncbi:MAG TPA: hypothetical protein VMW75_16420 [Thermoanaerobaculia bacterium]|nr:hypothetical protein [Thermoanaerobaculia bacterium]